MSPLIAQKKKRENSTRKRSCTKKKGEKEKSKTLYKHVLITDNKHYLITNNKLNIIYKMVVIYKNLQQ